MKRSFFATKSVSQASSISVTLPPCSRAMTRPSLVERSARLALPFAPLRRRISTAFSTSPSASSRAFLVSTMPVPSWSRSALMSAIVKFAMCGGSLLELSCEVDASAGPSWNDPAECACRRECLHRTTSALFGLGGLDIGDGLARGVCDGLVVSLGTGHIVGGLRRGLALDGLLCLDGLGEVVGGDGLIGDLLGLGGGLFAARPARAARAPSRRGARRRPTRRSGCGAG